MACGPTALLALERGFWNRLLGLGANRTLTVRAVKDLAASGPTNVELTTQDARDLARLANRSMAAAEQYMFGINPAAIDIPAVPQSSFEPFGGHDPAEGVNVGLIIRDPADPGSRMPLTFNVERLPRVGDLLNLIENSIAPECAEFYKNANICKRMEQVLAEYAGRNAGQFIPWQIWKEAQEAVEIVETFR